MSSADGAIAHLEAPPPDLRVRAPGGAEPLQLPRILPFVSGAAVAARPDLSHHQNSPYVSCSAFLALPSSRACSVPDAAKKAPRQAATPPACLPETCHVRRAALAPAVDTARSSPSAAPTRAELPATAFRC